MYVDDILLARSDTAALIEIKNCLKQYFITKDNEKPRYFLGIKITYQKRGLFLSHGTYVLDFFEEMTLLESTSANTSIKSDIAV